MDGSETIPQEDRCKPADQKVMSASRPQVLECILSHMSVVDVCRLSSVCRAWEKVALANKLWKHFCHRDEIDLRQLAPHNSDGQLPQGLCYKSLYKEYTLTLKKWTTGEGVAISSKPLTTQTMQNFSGDCMAVSSRYIFASAHTAQPIININNMLFGPRQRRRTRPDYSIHVFSAFSGLYSHQLEGLTDWPDHVLLSADETKVVAYYGSIVGIWNNVQSAECAHLLEHNVNVEVMKMNGNVLAVGLVKVSPSPSVYLWNIESGELMHKLDGVNRVDQMDMDGQHLVMYDRLDRVVQLWHVKTGRFLFTWTQTDWFNSIQLDADTKSLVGLGNMPITIWDTETGMLRARVQTDQRQVTRAMRINKGKLVVVYGDVIDCNESIGVVDLAACAGLLNSVNVGPYLRLPGVRGPIAKTDVVSVTDALILLPKLETNDIHVWNVKKRRFQRTMLANRRVVKCSAINASLKRMNAVVADNEKLTLDTYDFSVSMSIP